MHKQVGVLGRAGAFCWVPLEKPASVSQVGKNRKKGGLPTTQRVRPVFLGAAQSTA